MLTSNIFHILPRAPPLLSGAAPFPLFAGKISWPVVCLSAQASRPLSRADEFSANEIEKDLLFLYNEDGFWGHISGKLNILLMLNQIYIYSVFNDGSIYKFNVKGCS